MRLTPRSASSRQARRADDDIDRQLPGNPHDLRDFVRRLHARREQHVCAGFGVSSDPSQRLGQAAGVFAPNRLAAAGQENGLAARIDRRPSGSQPLDRFIQVVQGRAALAAIIEKPATPAPMQSRALS